MSSSCQAFRDELLAAGVPDAAPHGGAAAEGVRLWAHADGCEDCATWARRTARQARELEALPRPALPAELEGRVVAALEAGYRQARAARALADLGRVTSPAELDEAVDAEVEVAALAEALEGVEATDGSDEGALARRAVPGVLERLVAEELAAPSQARARRYLGSLRRRRAPEELRMRVGLLLSDRGGYLSGDRPGVFGLRTAVGLLVVALLVAVGSLVLRPATRPSTRPVLVIERVADPADLPPLAAALFDGASGGLLSVEGEG